MRKILLGCSLLALGLFAPNYIYAQTCEPRDNVPSYDVNKPAPIICDRHGSQHVKIVDTDGNIISLIPVATAAAPSYNEGAKVPLSSDLAGNTRTTLGTCISGESACNATNTTSYTRTRTDVLSSGQKAADAQIKGSAGWVSHMICAGTDNAATAGSIIIYDALTETGTAIFTFTVAALDYHIPIWFPINVVAATGIYLGYTTTGDVNCTVFYQ